MQTMGYPGLSPMALNLEWLKQEQPPDTEVPKNTTEAKKDLPN